MSFPFHNFVLLYFPEFFSSLCLLSRTTTMSSPKRRRIAEGDPLSDILPPSGTAHSEKLEREMDLIEADTVAMVLPDRILPELDEFAELLFEDLQQTESSLVAAGLEKLLALLQDGNRAKKKAKKAYSLGAHSIIGLVMKKWPADEAIQSSGCRCMMYLSFYNPLSAVRCGSVEAVVFAMKAYPNCQTIQSGGCCVLVNTLSGCETKTQAVRRVSYRFVKEMDGVAVILKAMGKFIEDEDVRQGGLGVFYNLSLDKLLIESLTKAGVPMTAVSVLARYPDDEDVQVYSKNIIANAFS